MFLHYPLQILLWPFLLLHPVTASSADLQFIWPCAQSVLNPHLQQWLKYSYSGREKDDETRPDFKICTGSLTVCEPLELIEQRPHADTCRMTHDFYIPQQLIWDNTTQGIRLLAVDSKTGHRIAISEQFTVLPLTQAPSETQLRKDWVQPVVEKSAQTSGRGYFSSTFNIKEFAVKVTPSWGYDMVRKDVEILTKMKHSPYFPKVEAYFEDKETKTGYLVMTAGFANMNTYLRSAVNRRYIAKNNKAFASKFSDELSSARLALDDAGIVHRDLHPKNILLAYNPSILPHLPATPLVLVIDFGTAHYKQVHPDLSWWSRLDRMAVSRIKDLLLDKYSDWKMRWFGLDLERLLPFLRHAKTGRDARYIQGCSEYPCSNSSLAMVYRSMRKVPIPAKFSSEAEYRAALKNRS